MIQIWQQGQCQWQFLIFQSGEDTDRELDCMLELPAARKPLNSPEEVALKSDCGNVDKSWSVVSSKAYEHCLWSTPQVLQYWNSCFEKEELSHLHFRWHNFYQQKSTFLKKHLQHHVETGNGGGKRSQRSSVQCPPWTTRSLLNTLKKKMWKG